MMAVVLWKPTSSDKPHCSKNPEYQCLRATEDPECSVSYSTSPRLMFSILMLLLGVFDALAWALLQRCTRERNRHVIKAIGIEVDSSSYRKHRTTSTLASPINVDPDPDANDIDAALSIYILSEYINSETESLSIRMGDVFRCSVDILAHCTLFALNSYPIFRMKKSSKKKEQNVSNALRGEIIAYMTAGMERSTFHTAHETFLKDHVSMLHMGGNNSNSFDLSHIEEQEWTDEAVHTSLNSALQKSHAAASHSQQRHGLQDVLRCEEKEPGRANYPENTKHDPKTHQGTLLWILW